MARRQARQRTLRPVQEGDREVLNLFADPDRSGFDRGWAFTDRDALLGKNLQSKEHKTCYDKELGYL